MSTAIQDLIKHSIGDGARPAKFEVQVMMPNSSSFSDNQSITVSAKTASFPGKAHEVISMKIKGRTIPLRGQTKYTQSWDCTFYLTEDHKLKTAFEEWIEAIDQKHNYDTPRALNVSALQSEFAGGTYTNSIVIYQNNFNTDNITSTYTLINAFPVQVSQVDVSSDSTSAVSEFTVTFAYSHFIVDGVSGGSTGVNLTDIQSVFDVGQTISNELAQIAQQTISATINRVTSSVGGVVSSAVENLVSSLF